MATTEIKAKLTLDGVEEIKRGLNEIGRVGQEAFNKIRDAAEKAAPGIGGKLDAAVANFKKSFGELQKASGEVSKSFRAVKSSAAEFGTAITTVASRVAITTAAVAGGVAAVGKLTLMATENADAVGKAAVGLGLTTKAYQELGFAAAQSGVNTEDFAKGFSRLNVVIGDALSGNKAALEKFQQLGVAITNADGSARPAEEVFKDLAQAISQIPDGATRAAVGSDFFGKSVAKWLPLIMEGRKGIEALQKQFENSGLGFTDNEIASATAMNDALSALGTVARQLRDKVFIKLAEPLRRAFDTATQVIVANADRILSVAQRLADQIGPILEDVVNALAGNDAAVRAQWVLDLKDQIIAFGQAAYDVITNVVIPAFETISVAAEGVAGTINALFGTEITGQALLLTVAVVKLSGAFAALGPALALVVNSGRLLISIFGLIGPALSSVAAFFPVLIAGAKAALVALSALVGWPLVIAAAIVTAAALIYKFWDDIVAYANSAWETIKQAAADGWAAVAGAGRSVWNALIDTFAEIKNKILGLWESLTTAMSSLWTGTVDFIRRSISSLYSFIDRVIGSIRRAISYAKALIGLSSGSGSGYASGGYISGPGTGTSDSIPAWLSNGEYVIRAAAVRKYGANLFSALNQMRLPRGIIPQFNVGGLVEGLTSQLVPRFAEGGLVALPAAAGGGRPINVTLGGETFAMTAPDDVAEKLVRYASKRRVANAGRKPSWYGA